MLGEDRLDLASYFEDGRRLTDDELLARIPEVHELASVSVVPYGKLESPAIKVSDWFALGRRIEAVLDGGQADGVVVVHGTNTLEETAFFLHLTLATDRPVALTGAMRPASAMSGDGDLNLINAIAAVSAPEAAGKGVLVVLNDTIHCARDVTKGNTSRVHAFRERDLGPLGYVDNDRRVMLYRAPVRRHTGATPFSLGLVDELPRVDVVTSYVEADGALIDAAVSAGAQGIVFAGTGAGMGTPSEEAALVRAANAGVAICISSRSGAGRVARRPALARRGFVAGDDLAPWKARVLLGLALAATTDPEELQHLFDTC